MKTRSIEYGKGSEGRQTPIFFPIKPQERFNQMLISHHLNLPLISQNQVVRKVVDRKFRLFQHDQDYNNVKTCCKVDENHQNETIINLFTDPNGQDCSRENYLIENYIKIKQQRYDDLIERNLDTLRNLEGNSFQQYKEKDLQQTYRKSEKNDQYFFNRAFRMKSIDVSLKDTPEKQQNNNQVFFQKNLQSKKQDLIFTQKTQEIQRNLDLNKQDSTQERGQTIFVRNNRPSVSNQIWEYSNLFRKYNKPQIRVKNKKFRIIVFVLIALSEISKNYKIKLKEQEKARQHFQIQQEPHIKYINFFGIKQHKTESRKFVDSLLQKIRLLYNDQKYIKECKTIQSEQADIRKDFQKQRLCLFIKLILKDLELITRKNIIPGFIHHSLNLCLFRGKNTQSSQFVINRTKFYSKTVHSLTQEQKVLIALEFLIFNIIIPNLLDIANELDQSNQDCFLVTLFHFIGIVGVFMVQFTNYFQKKFQLIKESNVKPIQRVINLKKNQQGIPCVASMSIVEKIDENENKIIQGGFEYSGILELFVSKPFWSQKMSLQFSRIVNNIGQLIEIANFD